MPSIPLRSTLLRSALAVFISLAVLLAAGDAPVSAGGGLTPEQRRGRKLIKNARGVGRAFRKEQKSANRAFVRDSKRLAKDVNKGLRTPAEALESWLELYEGVLRSRLARRDAAYAEFEGLLAAAELRPAKDATTTLVGDLAFHEGSGTGGARDACVLELVEEDCDWPGTCRSAIAPIRTACAEVSCPLAANFYSDGARGLGVTVGTAGGDILAVVASCDGTLCVTLRVDPSAAAAGHELHVLLDVGSTIATRTVELTEGDSVVTVKFDDVAPARYAIRASYSDPADPTFFADAGYGTISLLPKPDSEPDPGGGAEIETSISCTLDGEPCAADYKLVQYTETREGGELKRAECVFANPDDPSDSGNLYIDLFPNAGFDVDANETEYTVATPPGDVVMIYDPDGFSGEPQLDLGAAVITLFAINAIALRLESAFTRVEIDGKLANLRDGGPLKDVSVTIKLAWKDLAKFVEGSKR